MARLNTRLVDEDSGYQALMAEVLGFQPLTVEVGVFSAATPYDSDLSIVENAVIQEYGTETIPPRPFLRTAFERNAKRWAERMASGIRSLVYARIRKGATTRTLVGQRAFLNLCGAEFSADAQKTLMDGPWTANAPGTIRRKGRNEPLVDSGTLAGSIDHLVRTGR